MRIGYACLTVGVPGTGFRTCTARNATPDVLSELIGSNLRSLDNILDYNIKNGIELFRISSDIIPFGSHPVNTLRWWDDFGEELRSIGNKAIYNGIRLSMHPGQYTVLNSPDEDVVKRAGEDLMYHSRFLDAVGAGPECKIVLHIGGVYGDKKEAIERFVRNHRRLNNSIRRRLVIENDDRHYTISDVLSVGGREGIPVVFDNLHHRVNCDDSRTEGEWIASCGRTWSVDDGPQKLHYSQQDPGKRPGSHSATLNADEFVRFCDILPNRNVDIMAEVKDKNLSAVKCINAVSPPDIQKLEREWARYKYLVLEHSPKGYHGIRELLKDKSSYPVLEFYRLIDDALSSPVTHGNAVNAAQHVWGHLKNACPGSEAEIRRRMADSVLSAKRLMWKLAEKVQERYLLDSLYFADVYS